MVANFLFVIYNISANSKTELRVEAGAEQKSRLCESLEISVYFT